MRLILFLAVASAATAQTRDGVNFYSIEKEIELGKNLALEVQTTRQAQPDARLQAIGDKLAAQTHGTFQYRFFVYPQVSAAYEPIALPGGPVFVPQSMISTDDAETAAILAHAIAHIALRHYTRELTRRDLAEAGGKAAAMTVVGTNDAVKLARNNHLMQFTTNFEFDADRLAVKLMIDAGYDPQALVRWLRTFPVPKMNLALGDRPGPVSNVRIAAVQRAIEAAR
jgi:beta-barrel assembly-enhancing protease